MEIVQCGNPKVTDYVARRAKEKGQLGRIIFGNDAPSGTGIIPLGILRNICQVASVSDIPGEIALCMATGNSAKVYNKLNTGIIAVGREADLVFMDAPMGSVANTAVEAFECGDHSGPEHHYGRRRYQGRQEPQYASLQTRCESDLKRD